jgi:hypothetical protein
MKFLSFNICHGRPLSAVLQFLKQGEPDFALLQEVCNGKDKYLEENFRSLSIIQSRLKFKFFAFGVTHNIFYKNCLIPSGNLTLSKHQIVNSSFIFLPKTLINRQLLNLKILPVG